MRLWHTRPICLTLAFLLAFWTSAGPCCGAGVAAASEDASGTGAGGPAVPSCHAVPASDASTSDKPTSPVPCEDHDCTCASLLVSGCQVGAVELLAIPAPAGYPAESLLAPAPVQPLTWLPHTFFPELLEREHDLPRPGSAPTLVALSCQLTR